MSQLNNGIPIDTETLRQIKAQRPVRKDKQYVFRLEARQVQKARELDLPDSALIALAAINAAAFGARRNDWITLPPRTVDAFGRGFGGGIAPPASWKMRA